ncbi:MAG: hypothetical protein PHO15_07405, partial [Eubacteriales bacterium]|nr:hypothetical protein [Eubacteriales bacterium]
GRSCVRFATWCGGIALIAVQKGWRTKYKIFGWKRVQETFCLLVPSFLFRSFGSFADDKSSKQ